MIKSLYPLFQKWCQNGSIWIISDTHFEDSDCHLMSPFWIPPEEHVRLLKIRIHKNDTLIHLGDVGNPQYIDQIKGYKVLITGNHDILSKVQDSFDEVFTGPLFIADRIVLSHEPLYGLEGIALNIHGHDHGGLMCKYEESLDCYTHINLASNVCNFIPYNLGEGIKRGDLKNIQSYHRVTIDKATAKKERHD